MKNNIQWKLWTSVKNSDTGQLLFFVAHILAHMVFVYLLPEVRNRP
jgi:hypothetical protein